MNKKDFEKRKKEVQRRKSVYEKSITDTMTISKEDFSKILEGILILLLYMFVIALIIFSFIINIILV